MKKIVLATFLCLVSTLFLPLTSQALPIEKVGTDVEARTESSSDQVKLGVIGGVTPNGTEFFGFSATNEFGKTLVVFNYYIPKNVNGIKESLAKAVEWAEVARKNKAETVKELGCFGRGCKSADVMEGKVRLGFISENRGENVRLRVYFYQDAMNKTVILLKPDQIPPIIDSLDSLEVKMQSLREESEKNKKLFQ